MNIKQAKSARDYFISTPKINHNLHSLFYLFLFFWLEFIVICQSVKFYQDTSDYLIALNLFFSINVIGLLIGMLSKSFRMTLIIGVFYTSCLTLIWEIETSLKREFDASELLLLFITNWGEASEFILGNQGILIILILNAIMLFFLALKGIRFSKAFSNGLAAFLMLSVLTGVFASEIGIVKKSIDMALMISAAKEMANRDYSDRINFSFAAEKVTSKEKEIYILFIGESARYDRWSINGYDRNTSPELDKNEIISFHDVISGSNGTYGSIPMLVTRATPKNYYQSFKERSIAGLFEEAGYTTLWITMQEMHIYKPDTMIVDNLFGRKRYDEALIETLLPYIDQYDKLFIVLHAVGSHYNYDTRYPNERFTRFSPNVRDNIDYNPNIIGEAKGTKQQLDNSYDNTIAYADYILGKIITELEGKNLDALLMYTSDHGENLWDDSRQLIFHLNAHPSLVELQVPLFIYANNNYKNNHKIKWNNLKKNTHKKITHSYVFHTLADLAGIQYPDQAKEFSLANSKIKIEPRYFLNKEQETESIQGVY